MPNTVDLRWDVDAECGAELSEGGVPLEQWLREGNAHVVKHRPHRTVYRVDLPERSLFVKHYRCLSWRDIGRTLMRRSNARREWRKSREVARRGVPTATSLAVGEQRPGLFIRDSFLVSEAIEDTWTLDRFTPEVLDRLPPPLRARLRRELIDRLAELCACAHDAGVRQTDMHAGNVLVQWAAQGSGGELTDPTRSVSEAATDPILAYASGYTLATLGLFLIDLPTVRFSGPLGWSKSRDNLAKLCAGQMAHTTPWERWRLWRRYLAARKHLSISCPRRAAADVVRGAFAWGQYITRQRGRRCLKNNRDFYGLQTPDARGHAVAEVPREQLAGLLADPESPLRAFRHHAAKLSHSSVVVQGELQLAREAVRVAYKRSREKHWWKAWLPFRRSRAMRGWRMGHALQLRGIATARPLLVCQPSRGRDSYLATEWLDGAENLHLYGWRLAELLPEERARLAGRCLESLGRLIGRMHAWHVTHRDLKGGNLAVVQGPRDTQVYLLDLDGVRIARRMKASAAVQNLARLAVSLRLHPWVTRTTRLRFLRAYLKQRGTSRDWKPLWRQVARRCERITGRIERSGRTVA